MSKTKKITLIGVTAIVIVVLVFQFLFFKGSVKTLTHGYLSKQPTSTTISNDYKPFQYTIHDYTIKIKFPDTTDIHVSSDQGDKMRFSMYFTNSSKLPLRGYIQAWEIDDLEHFLSDNKSLSPFNFKSYSISKVQENNYNGLKTEWTGDYGKNFICGKEYWFILNNSKEVVRVSFFTDTAKFPAELQNVIEQILNSFDIVKNN